MWVRAMDVYARVARVVEPKKAVLRGAEEALARAAEALAAKQGQLAEVEAQVGRRARSFLCLNACKTRSLQRSYEQYRTTLLCDLLDF